MNPTNIANNKYCGPAVLSSITGLNTDEIEKLVHKFRGDTRPVKGMYMSEITGVLRDLRINTEILGFSNQRMSLFRLLFSLDNGLFIVAVPGHFILIEVDGNKKYICDNHTKKPINLGSSARLQQEVVQVVKVIYRDTSK